MRKKGDRRGEKGMKEKQKDTKATDLVGLW